MIRFIVEPIMITTIRERGGPTQHDVDTAMPAPDALQVATTMCAGLSELFGAMIFCGYPHEPPDRDPLKPWDPPVILAHPDPSQANDEQRDALQALKEAVGELPV